MRDSKKLKEPKTIVTAGNEEIFTTATGTIWGCTIDQSGLPILVVPTRDRGLRGPPLVGSECVFPQCNNSFVITRGSAKPSAFGLPVHFPRAHQKHKQKKWNSRHSEFSNRQMPNGTATNSVHTQPVTKRSSRLQLAPYGDAPSTSLDCLF